MKGKRVCVFYLLLQNKEQTDRMTLTQTDSKSVSPTVSSHINQENANLD